MRALILFVMVAIVAGCGPSMAEVKQFAANRRAAAIEANPNWSEQHKSDILNGTIRKGMTTDMVLASWGGPITIEKTSYSWAKIEDWIYYNNWPREYRAVHFRNGLVSDWTITERN